MVYIQKPLIVVFHYKYSFCMFLIQEDNNMNRCAHKGAVKTVITVLVSENSVFICDQLV